jgi:hypothetical protein
MALLGDRLDGRVPPESGSDQAGEWDCADRLTRSNIDLVMGKDDHAVCF